MVHSRVGLVSAKFPLALLLGIRQGQKHFAGEFPADPHGDGHRQPSHLPEQDPISVEG